jgi:hypothetical protein
MGTMSRLQILFIITAVFLLYDVSWAGSVEFFSSDKISPNPHAALLRSNAVNALYMYSAQNRTHYMEYDLGAKIPGISIRNADGAAVEIGGGGGVFSRFQLFSESFNFIHADFNGSLYTDVKYRHFLFETSVYHTSSHIGDDYIHYRHGAVKNTGYEAVKHYTSYLTDYVDISIGFEYKFSRRPVGTIFPDPSIFLGTRLDLLSIGIPFFMECEIEIIAGKHLPNVGIRAGVYLKYILNALFLKKHQAGHEPHELSVYYYNGYSKMGYFYNRRESLVLFGPTYRY